MNGLIISYRLAKIKCLKLIKEKNYLSKIRVNAFHLVEISARILYNKYGMEKKIYANLKSGTDVRGVAVKSATREVQLTDKAVYDITCAFVKWLAEKTGKFPLTVAVGNDVRLSCDRIVASVKRALLESGCSVIYCGVCSTPSMFMLLKKSGFGADASVMITASHMPYDMNGLKFFTPEGGLEGDDVAKILSVAEKQEKLSGLAGTYVEKSYMDEYCRGLVDLVRTACGRTAPLRGKRIIVDAGNGVGGFFTEYVLRPLGADTTGSQYLEHDGLFPHHAPNPEDKEAIRSLSRAVMRSGADLGVIFDTDVDRAGLVDKNGEEINRNRLIALASATLLQNGGTIVTDSVTSDGLTQFIKAHGGKHVRFKRGYKNVIDEAKRRQENGEYCPLAIETSGHAAFKDNYYLDDGAYLVCRLLITLAKQAEKGQTLTALISSLSLPREEKEVRIGFNAKSLNFKREGDRVIEELKHFAAASRNVKLAPVNYEGARVNFPKGNGDGWLLVRMSVHDPVMPINFESNTAGGNKIMARKLYYMLKKYPFLELANLEKFINA